MEVRRDGPPRPGTPEKSSHSTRSIPKDSELPRIGQMRRVAKQHAASVSELYVGIADKNRCLAGGVLKHLDGCQEAPQTVTGKDDSNLDTIAFPDNIIGIEVE